MKPKHIAIAVLLLLVGCSAFKRTAWVGGGSGAGAAAGSLLGPGGAIGGAVVGGAVTSSVVESDASAERADRMETRLYGAPQPQPGSSTPHVPWWAWLVALWVWLRRAHLLSALTGSEPRLDAILRALGLRTHKTPIKKGGDS